MRLVLTVRGVDVVDLELRWPGKSSDHDEPPKIEATGQLAAAELAQPTEPDTTVFGFAPRREA